MNKSLRWILIFTALLSLYSSTSADYIQNYEKEISVCNKILSSSKNPDYTIVSYITGPMIDKQRKITPYDACLYKGYKGNVFQLLAVKNEYLEKVGIDNISPENIKTTSGSVYPVATFPEIKVDLWAEQIVTPDLNTIKYITTEYTIDYSLENWFLAKKSKKTIKYTDTTPDKTIIYDKNGNTDLFSDIKNHKYQNAINYLAEKNIVQGHWDGRFKPDQLVTRAEFLKMTFNSEIPYSRIIDQHILSWVPRKRSYYDFSAWSTTSCFSDVIIPWQFPYTCAARSWKAITGFKDGTFKPNQHISLSEALKILLSTQIEKMEKTNPWHISVINEASYQNLIPLDSYSVNEPLTRGQVADIITRFLKTGDEKTEYLKSSFKDNADRVMTLDNLSTCRPITTCVGNTAIECAKDWLVRSECFTKEERASNLRNFRLGVITTKDRNGNILSTSTINDLVEFDYLGTQGMILWNTIYLKGTPWSYSIKYYNGPLKPYPLNLSKDEAIKIAESDPFCSITTNQKRIDAMSPRVNDYYDGTIGGMRLGENVYAWEDNNNVRITSPFWDIPQKNAGRLCIVRMSDKKLLKFEADKDQIDPGFGWVDYIEIK